MFCVACDEYVAARSLRIAAVMILVEGELTFPEVRSNASLLSANSNRHLPTDLNVDKSIAFTGYGNSP